MRNQQRKNVLIVRNSIVLSMDLCLSTAMHETLYEPPMSRNYCMLRANFYIYHNPECDFRYRCYQDSAIPQGVTPGGVCHVINETLSFASHADNLPGSYVRCRWRALCSQCHWMKWNAPYLPGSYVRFRWRALCSHSHWMTWNGPYFRTYGTRKVRLGMGECVLVRVGGGQGGQGGML